MMYAPWLHLIEQQRSWSHDNQTVRTLWFLYRVTLGRADAVEWIAAAREPQKLPIVLSPDEVIHFIEAVSGLCNLQPGRLDHCVRRWIARRRDRPTANQRYRQWPDVDQDRVRQRWQRSLCHAVAATFHDARRYALGIVRNPG